MLTVTTIDDFVNLKYQDELQTIMLNLGSFPWYYEPSTCNYSVSDGIFPTERTKECGQFTHTFYSQGKIMSDYYPLVEQFLPVLEERFGKNFKDSIIRIKANLILNNAAYPDNFYNTPHVDDYSNVETALYYVNDSDGDTVIFVEDENKTKLLQFNRITPTKGKLVLFDSSYFHASTPPKSAAHRAVINFVFRR